MTYSDVRTILLMVMILNYTLARHDAPGYDRHPPEPQSVNGSGMAEAKTRGGGRKNSRTKLFMNKLGLQTWPQSAQEHEVPEFMLELYRQRIGIGYFKVRGYTEVNTVTSFIHQEIETNNCRPPSCSRLHFNVSTIFEDKLLAGAELRVFVSLENEGGKPTSASEHKLEVHEVIRPETSETDAITRLLDSRTISLITSGWESFDIHPAVLKWKRGVNHGMEVRLVSKAPQLSTERHVRLRRSADVKDKEWSLQRPQLVTYSSNHLKPRSTDTPKKTSKKRKRKKTRKGMKNYCRKHHLYVSFEDLGWKPSVIHPTGYTVNICSGQCPSPIPDFISSTNHANVMSRVNRVSPEKASGACCVPTKYSSLTMLYVAEEGVHQIKTFEDMIAEECGCR